MTSLLNPANVFTLSRVLLIPFIYHSITHENWPLALSLLLFSLVSDFLDGQVARRFNCESALGALLDPVADKVVVISYTLLLWHWQVLPLWIIAILNLRNISQLMAIPILSWWLKRDFKVKPKSFPKWATALSFVLILLGVFSLYLNSPVELNTKDDLAFANQWLLLWLSPLAALMDLWILVTYWPRLIQIARGTHDTFE